MSNRHPLQICPTCANEEITVEGTYYLDDFQADVEQVISCNMCNATWSEKYIWSNTIIIDKGNLT